MTKAKGGCLCGRHRYAVTAEPIRTTICHCRFCQRATGVAYMVQPVFAAADFAMLTGPAQTYTHLSEGSGKEVYVHFCAACGTKLYLTFQRFPGFVGLYRGTFDNPNWFAVTPETSKHIFLGQAQQGTVIPAGVNCFMEHAAQSDGTAIAPTVFDSARTIRGN
ncbi:GFA family protein [Pseudorhodobacter sp. E13]|uniref:GFA family protein n=1 Tax=Pseudorhodobacter sp. E13 TaxID=2487931 RepID=UPI0018F7B885|nr:GFA family protein [Pseudorhodobacter sp. E13]